MARYFLKLIHTWPLEHPNGIKFTSCAIQVDQTAQVFDACSDSDVVVFMQIMRGKYQSWGCQRTGRKVTDLQISCSAHIYICTLAKHAAYGITHESGDCQQFQQMKHLAPWQECPPEKALNSWNGIFVNILPREVPVISPNSRFSTTTTAHNRNKWQLVLWVLSQQWGHSNRCFYSNRITILLYSE